MQCYNQVTWNWLNHLEVFLKTGNGINYHESLNKKEWELYQRGMENLALTISRFIVKMGPHLKDPERMLDIGGAHGLFSLEYVKKYPTLTATILDLPLAVDCAEPLLRSHYDGNSIEYRSGDALIESLGTEEYDLIFVGSLMHHFTDGQNTLLCSKIFTALKPNGFLVIQEFVKPEEKGHAETISSSMDLFFNLSSNSGGWSARKLIEFQSASGLKPIGIKKFLTVPGLVQLTAQKKSL